MVRFEVHIVNRVIVKVVLFNMDNLRFQEMAPHLQFSMGWVGSKSNWPRHHDLFFLTSQKNPNIFIASAICSSKTRLVMDIKTIEWINGQTLLPDLQQDCPLNSLTPHVSIWSRN